MTEKEKEDWYYDVFKPKLYNKRFKKKLWYEVGIDVDEVFVRRWFDFAYKYPNLAVGAIRRWMIARDKWYWGPEYVKQLEKAQSKGLSAVDALTVVLVESLK